MAVGRYIISTAGAVCFVFFFRCFWWEFPLLFLLEKYFWPPKQEYTYVEQQFRNKKNNDNNNNNIKIPHIIIISWHRNLFLKWIHVSTMFTFNGVALCSMVQKCENKLEILIEKFHPQYNFSLSLFSLSLPSIKVIIRGKLSCRRRK